MPEPKPTPVEPKIQMPEPKPTPVEPKIQMPEPEPIPVAPKIQIPEPAVTPNTAMEAELQHTTHTNSINENNNTTSINNLSTAISIPEKDNNEIEKLDAASEIEDIEDLPPDDTLSEDNTEQTHHTEITPKRVIEHNPLVPPAMLGVLGGGQLGRMLAMAAKTMGYRITVWDPDPLSPAAEFADEHICAPFDDEEAKEKMSHCDAITTEFENVSADSMRELANKTRVIPSGDMVAIAQNRIAEKAAIRKASLPVCPYQAIRSMEDVNERTPQLLPGILKTATMGYDGKGQRTIKTSAGLHMSLSSMMEDAPFILERILDLRAELSVIVCRLDDEHITCFPPAENIHENGILSYSIVPARLPESLLSRAEVMAKHLAQKMDYVGVLAVEMFVVGEKQQLVVNEIAPRPHNSGHYTLDACNVSQFQQQVRILCDVPPIQTSLLSPCCMINLLGDLWKPDGSMPNWTPVMNDPDAYLHLYGKAEARSGRKMGHITVLAETSEQAFERAQKLFDEICFS